MGSLHSAGTRILPNSVVFKTITNTKYNFLKSKIIVTSYVPYIVKDFFHAVHISSFVYFISLTLIHLWFITFLLLKLLACSLYIEHITFSKASVLWWNEVCFLYYVSSGKSLFLTVGKGWSVMKSEKNIILPLHRHQIPEYKQSSLFIQCRQDVKKCITDHWIDEPLYCINST